MDSIHHLIMATPWQHHGNKKPDSQDFFVKYIHSSYIMFRSKTRIGCAMLAKIEWE